VPLVVIAPLVGIAIVPVTLPVGAGLTPSDVISVASIGIPAAPTDPPGLIPRGEVVPSEGIAVSGSSTWANAGLHSKGQAVATIKKGLMTEFRFERRHPAVWRAPMSICFLSICFSTISLGAKLSDIAQSLVIAFRCQWWRMKLRKNQQRQMFNFLFSVASLMLRLVPNVSDESHGWHVVGSPHLFN
jgi:hypothetical protein